MPFKVEEPNKPLVKAPAGSMCTKKDPTELPCEKSDLGEIASEAREGTRPKPKETTTTSVESPPSMGSPEEKVDHITEYNSGSDTANDYTFDDVCEFFDSVGLGDLDDEEKQRVHALMNACDAHYSIEEIVLRSTIRELCLELCEAEDVYACIDELVPSSGLRNHLETLDSFVIDHLGLWQVVYEFFQHRCSRFEVPKGLIGLGIKKSRKWGDLTVLGVKADGINSEFQDQEASGRVQNGVMEHFKGDKSSKYLYHGTTLEHCKSVVQNPRTDRGKEPRDFGDALYVTEKPYQAARWALRCGHAAIPVVIVWRIPNDDPDFKDLSNEELKRSESTVKFIRARRLETDFEEKRKFNRSCPYDIISGPVARTPKGNNWASGEIMWSVLPNKEGDPKRDREYMSQWALRSGRVMGLLKKDTKDRVLIVCLLRDKTLKTPRFGLRRYKTPVDTYSGGSGGSGGGSGGGGGGGGGGGSGGGKSWKQLHALTTETEATTTSVLEQVKVVQKLLSTLKTNASAMLAATPPDCKEVSELDNLVDSVTQKAQDIMRMANTARAKVATITAVASSKSYVAKSRPV